MITTKQGMDPHSFEILRDDVPIGVMQWHPGRQVGIELWTAAKGYLTLNEIDQVRERYTQILRYHEGSTHDKGETR